MTMTDPIGGNPGGPLGGRSQLIHVSERSASPGYSPAMWKRTRRAILVVFAGVVFAAAAARADDGKRHRDGRDDHDAAREALEHGEVLPLGDILDRVQGQLPGRILKVEFERDDGLWIYEFTVLGSNGRRVEVYVDAATAEILSQHED